ncbi:hypothetical protein K505DRAFT_395692 [Melanomma pulvis-pyrius CBS 109.77]|uniref:Mid2 domain-containing protein n=1 Tax=Melanomma pulvis-pyrius CBS 109.77 TaxID=1314802 RepID=A0A6A6WV35_9PLEO|nr:hypothetical protein K505DRAFT_395692 [Melanomma pulvis-pyrius CBS 109.77]
MRFLTFLSILCLSFLITNTSATSAKPDIVSRQNSAFETRARVNIRNPSTTTSKSTQTQTTSPASTKHRKSKSSGLTTASKIGIGVGVPVGVLALAGCVAAYTIGKRRGRKRIVDPNAGAGKWVRDPSNELNIPPPTPEVVELPAVRSDEFDGARKGGQGWWKGFGRSASSMRAPQSPQELPA